MDKLSERETHDFMNVESFSQLPFIRPAPASSSTAVARDKGAGAIRLFGKEFGGDGDVNNTNEESSESATTNLGDVGSGGKDNENTENNRKFECHYCCRNFPTSQALGGHQNAHKRERQHAKRAHLQSSMAHNSIIPDGHLYGSLVNYRQNLSYPSWNYSSNNRFYGFSTTSAASHHHLHPHQSSSSASSTKNLNGSSLGLWRIPTVHQQNNLQGFENRTMNHYQHQQPLPLFAGEHQYHHRDLKSVPVTATGSLNRHVYESSKENVQDQVSLDLRL